MAKGTVDNTTDARRVVASIRSIGRSRLLRAEYAWKGDTQRDDGTEIEADACDTNEDRKETIERSDPSFLEKGHRKAVCPATA